MDLPKSPDARQGPERRVILAGELTERERELIARAEVAAEHTHLDAELKDWQP